MEKENLDLSQIKLVGISVRTNNAKEQDPATAQIGITAQRYFQEAMSSKISHRKNPGVTWAVYTDYESDFNGDYTYFIGEEVSSKDEIAGLESLMIPPQTYTKFTTESDVMPHVCITAWQKIWQMKDLESQRNYVADFEIYDERARDPQNTVLDIYIGIQK